MKKAILEITPEDPNRYFSLETNGINKVQLVDGIRACLQALEGDVVQAAIEAVGDDPRAIAAWIHSQRAEHIKAQMVDPKMN